MCLTKINSYLQTQGWCTDMERIELLKECIANTHFRIYELSTYLEKLEEWYDEEQKKLREEAGIVQEDFPL